MAKSLRSKWRRKMKAEKRVRYGKKETDRLVKMLTEAGDYQMLPEVKEEPIEMSDPTETDTMDNLIVGEVIAPPRYPPKTLTTNRKRSKSQHDSRRLSRRSRRDDLEENDSSDNEKDTAEEGMDTTKEQVERIFNKRTKRDQFGNYPSWMSARKVTAHKKRNKRLVSRANKLKTKKKV